MGAPGTGPLTSTADSEVPGLCRATGQVSWCQLLGGETKPSPCTWVAGGAPFEQLWDGSGHISAQAALSILLLNYLCAAGWHPKSPELLTAPHAHLCPGYGWQTSPSNRGLGSKPPSLPACLSQAPRCGDAGPAVPAAPRQAGSKCDSHSQASEQGLGSAGTRRHSRFPEGQAASQSCRPQHQAPEHGAPS